MATAVRRPAAHGITRNPKQSVKTAQDETEAEYEKSVPTWHSEARLPGAQPTADANFTLEDEGFATFCDEVLSGCWLVGNQRLPGCPVLAVSAGFEAMTGYTAAEVVGKSSHQALQGPKTEPLGVCEYAAAVPSLAMGTVDWNIRKKNGKPLLIRVCSVPVCDSSGDSWLSLQFVFNLSQQRRKEPSQPQSPQQQQQQLADHASGVSKWMEQVHQCIGALHVETVQSSSLVKITSCSSELAVMTGYSQAELCHSSSLGLMGPDTSSHTTRHFTAAQLAGRSAVAKLLLYRKDGSPFWALVASCPLVIQETAGLSSSADPARPQQQQQQEQHQQQQRHMMVVINTTAARPRKIGKYVLGRVLGQGASGIVRIGKNTTTDEVVAIKAVDATRFRSITEIEQVQEEMAVLATLKHPNIIRLLEVHFVNSCFYFVMEYASGGSMVRYIYSQDGGKLSESQAQQLFGQILSALEYCHKRRVIHRDLKPENILMEGNSPKVADFGLAGVMNTFGGGGFTLQCGTPEFTAPEIVEGKEYEGPAVDLWSVGVMLYEALTGHLPFKGPSQSALFKAIQRGVYPPLPQSISHEARDLIRKLLTVDPAARINWSELSRHPWLSSSNPCSSNFGRSSLTNIGQQSGVFSLESNVGSSSSFLSRLKTNSTAATEGICGTAGKGCSSLHEGSKSLRSCSSENKMRGSDSGDTSLGSEASRGSCRQEEVSDAEAGDADVAVLAAEGTGTTFAGLSGSAAVAGALGVSSSLEVSGSKRLAASFSSGSCHESVRVIIPDSSRDDPITAAIKQRLTGGGDASSVCSEGSSDHCCCSPSNRAHSFSGVVSPATPGGTRLAQNSKTGVALGKLTQVPCTGSSRQSCSIGSLPLLSPSPGAGALTNSGRSKINLIGTAVNSNSTSYGGPASSRTQGKSNSSPARERRRSLLVASKVQGLVDVGSSDSIGSLPPISRDRSNSRQHP